VGIAASTILIAIGAILAWGVDAAVPHADLRTIGVILMIVGAVGFIASLAIEVPRRRVRQSRYYRDGSAAPGGMAGTAREERVYEDREVF
jgi:hypothetical protein